MYLIYTPYLSTLWPHPSLNHYYFFLSKYVTFSLNSVPNTSFTSIYNFPLTRKSQRYFTNRSYPRLPWLNLFKNAKLLSTDLKTTKTPTWSRHYASFACSSHSCPIPSTLAPCGVPWAHPISFPCPITVPAVHATQNTPTWTWQEEPCPSGRI